MENTYSTASVSHKRALKPQSNEPMPTQAVLKDTTSQPGRQDIPKMGKQTGPEQLCPKTLKAGYRAIPSPDPYAQGLHRNPVQVA